MGRSRYRYYDNSHPYFVTCAVVGWLPLFADPTRAHILIDSLAYLHHHDRLRLHAYVVMENHLHLIASSTDLARQIRIFKSYTARQMIDQMREANHTDYLSILRWKKAKHKSDRTYQLWQEGSHPKMILDLAMLRQKIEYIHNNPVKRGYVDQPEHWRYSSARNYQELQAVLEIEELY